MSMHTDSNELNDYYYPRLRRLLEVFVSLQRFREKDVYKRIKTGVLKCFDKLLSVTNRVNNDAQDNSDSLLHLAAKTESIEILETLLLKGAIVNAKNHALETPLHYALKNRETGIVHLLLRYGADPKIVNIDNLSSFHFLIKFCGESMINTFLENGVPFDFHLSSGKQFLEFAVANNSVKIVQLVFDHSDKLEEEDIHGSTLLHEAVKNNNIEIVKLLLKNGFNVNATSDLGSTPLQIAIEQKLEDVVIVLLDNNADVNRNDNNNVPILHQVISYEYLETFKNFLGNNATSRPSDASDIIDIGYKKILTLLLEHGADVNIIDSQGFMPIHRAVQKSRNDLFLLLLEKGGDINVTTTTCGSTPLHLLANTYTSHHSEDTDYLSEYLLENGANTKAKNKYDLTPLDNALECQNLLLVSDILDKNPDPYDENNKLSFFLSFIDFHENDEHDDCFLESSAIQSKNGITAAELFFERGFTICIDDFKDVYVPEGLRYQVEDNFESSEFRTLVFNVLNKKEVTNPAEVVKLYMEYLVLVGSIKRGFTCIVNNLLTPVVNVNVHLHTGRTFLHIACKFGHLSFVEEFLKRGADVNAVDFDKMSALHFSVLRDHANITDLLLKNQAIIEARNNKNQTSLFVAVRERSYKCIKLLLDSGANINFVDVDRKSPLHVAAENNDIFSAKILLFCGANCNEEIFCPSFDTDAYTHHLPIELVEILFNHGAKMIGLDKFLKYETYVKFIIKSIAANVDNLDFPEDSTTEDFRIKCQEEIEKMKLMRIKGFNISMYEILINEEKKIAMYLRNENVIRALSLLDFENLFPIYCNKLKTRLMKGRRFNGLLELGYHCFEAIFKSIIPSVVMNKIFLYLDERDLRCLINASPIASELKPLISSIFVF